MKFMARIDTHEVNEDLPCFVYVDRGFQILTDQHRMRRETSCA